MDNARCLGIIWKVDLKNESLLTKGETHEMDELVDLIVKETGLSEDMARKVVDTVINFLKEKLPEPIAGQLDNFIDGQAGNIDLDQVKGMLGGLGGLFGGKK
jgi:polyhydroxyalkanoate synthesis regulator phasin